MSEHPAVPIGASDDDADATHAILKRLAATGADFARWHNNGQRIGWCSRPIRISGAVTRVDPETGQIVGSYCTDNEPDGVGLLACRSRRCPECGPIYQLQQFLLFRAGLAGGKGVPTSVATHPAAFATFTAPSFGAVHTRRDSGGSCVSHPGRCAHDRTRGCGQAHDVDDPLLGAPICWRCFEYQHLVLWNAMFGRLWERTQTQIRRRLAALAGLSQRRAAKIVKLSHSGVVELQRRGAVHRHVVLRLDARTGPDEPITAPPPPFDDPALLISAIRLGAATARVTIPGNIAGVPQFATWGPQIDISIIAAQTPDNDE